MSKIQSYMNINIVLRSKINHLLNHLGDTKNEKLVIVHHWFSVMWTIVFHSVCLYCLPVCDTTFHTLCIFSNLCYCTPLTFYYMHITFYFTTWFFLCQMQQIETYFLMFRPLSFWSSKSKFQFAGFDIKKNKWYEQRQS